MRRCGFLPLALALLLAGCGAETPSALPETASTEPLSAPAVVTEGRAPEKDYDLPAEMWTLIQWAEDSRPVALLAEVPERDAALYGIADGDRRRVLLRWGDSLAEFDWDYVTPQSISPRLWCFDADGDGAEELAAVCYYGGGTGVSIEQLHIVEKTADGTLTDYRLPEDTLCGGQLSEALHVRTAEGRTFAALGTELVDITSFLSEETPPVGLISGSIVYFPIDPAAEDGVPIRFRGSVWLDGEGYPPTVCYAAALSATVTYEDGVFTLSDLHLNSL